MEINGGLIVVQDTVVSGSLNVGVSAAASEGLIHVRTAEAVGVNVSANADELVLENNGNAGLTIKTPTSNTAYIYFAGATTGQGGFVYDHATDVLTIKTNNDNRVRIDDTGDIEVLTDNATIRPNTVDGSDSRQLFFCGGGAWGATRGGGIGVAGNEDGNTGKVYITAGNVTGGEIVFNTGGAEKAKFTKDGYLVCGLPGITATPATELYVFGNDPTPISGNNYYAVATFRSKDTGETGFGEVYLGGYVGTDKVGAIVGGNELSVGIYSSGFIETARFTANGLMINNGAEPSSSAGDQIVVYSVDVSSASTLGLRTEASVAAETDETKFSHKLPVRINGATYYIMLTQT